MSSFLLVYFTLDTIYKYSGPFSDQYYNCRSDNYIILLLNVGPRKQDRVVLASAKKMDTTQTPPKTQSRKYFLPLPGFKCGPSTLQASALPKSHAACCSVILSFWISSFFAINIKIQIIHAKFPNPNRLGTHWLKIWKSVKRKFFKEGYLVLAFKIWSFIGEYFLSGILNFFTYKNA